jgi:predicted helicase
MTTIHDILAEFRDAATSNRDLGDRFERLILQFLKTDPLYQDQFSEVWLWMDFPKRAGEADTGIDLVAEKANGDGYCAIQCKFYDPSHTLDKQDIDSFFTASGKSLYTSRLIVSTTDNWSKHAEKALDNQQIPVSRLRVQDLADSAIDWSGFSLKHPEKIQLRAKKQLRPHQIKASEKVMTGFETGDRGKLIMACGTGKTFTSLKIAEKFVPKGAIALFLVPSISLLSQTLREWTAESARSLHCVAVCSDKKVGKKSDSEDIHTYDLALPATTDAQEIIKQVKGFQGKQKDLKDLTVIFSTYQSIQAIAAAQKVGLPEFDLIICDEAHRTTGVTLSGVDESHFVKVHDQNFIKGKKRLYMTATPRIYSDGTKTQAKENDAVICSMDDPKIFGQEFHRLGFSEAVGAGLLTDYKVLVLAVDEKYVSKTFQRQLSDANDELNLEDAVRVTGCWNGLSKRMLVDIGGDEDFAPMRRAVAFSRSIKDSEKVVRLFSEIIDEYRRSHPNEEILNCEVDHVDGTMNSLKRNQKLDWLKEDTSQRGNVCRILSNARCLSEGVDVPDLDAVMFLNPRNSIVDVVQSVGRVMRKAKGKKYGYIILPIGIPADISPEEALKNNDKYRVVWSVLQALRAHDDRFNATVNKIELNQKKPEQISVIGVGGTGSDDDGSGGSTDVTDPKKEKEKGSNYVQIPLNFPNLEEWREAIYAKVVVKCGNRRYWEDWAKDVSVIAENHVTRIKALLESPEDKHREAFADFLEGLRENLNPSISQDDAIEMLSQHLITKPVFDALFEDYPFTQSNPVSQVMQSMLDLLEGEAIAKEAAKLEKFYSSVRERAAGIDNAQGKQRIIIELYDKFFRNAFPKMAERLGIVYTPVEVVDFIIRSADVALKQEFGVGLTDEGVHILDPFTGTGTFMVRLLQSGLIKPEDLTRKFKQELHANELVLLAYYIAAINIEETYHDLIKKVPLDNKKNEFKVPLIKGDLGGSGGDSQGEIPPSPPSQGGNTYQPFEGIVLTDTFQMFENEGSLLEKIFPENNKRVRRQKQNDIRVIIGNPPYSAGQNSENDGNKNLKYDNLDQRIRETYGEFSTATNKNSLYDSYIRGIRWASDRMKDKGIIAYVTNGSFIDNNAMDGLRKSLTDEFSSVYCFNLRGNARTSGEDRRKEKGNVFGEGTRTPVAITLLIKNPKKTGKCELFYHDIGDYLSREDKLEIIQRSIDFSRISWEKMKPNDSYDWINQRDPAFDKFISLGEKETNSEKTIFDLYSLGINTNRDTWIYNYSKNVLVKNMQNMINFYNDQVKNYELALQKKLDLEIDDFVDNNPQKIKWSSSLKQKLSQKQTLVLRKEKVREAMYRPYFKQWLYFNRVLNHRVGKTDQFFPDNKENLTISVTGISATKDFSVLIINCLPDLELIAKSRTFPLYRYEKVEKTDQTSLFTETEGYTKKENIPDEILEDFQQNYSTKQITKEDIFYYIYGILHSPEYKTRFAADLKKMLPRIPYAEDFWAFSKAGRELAHWHLNYEAIEPYPLVEYQSELYIDDDDYRVEKMVFGNRNKDKTTIIYNSKIKLSGIPLEAYDYIVNGKSALEWIIERYQYTKDKDSGITNDPNDWSEEPRYILDLVKRIVRVSVETVKIVNSLPALKEKK